jgi:pyrrolidone-carboxylate peptidase
MSSARILLTAFEPFGGDPVNPSLLIARALDGQMVAGAQVAAVELPCVFHRALAVLGEALKALKTSLSHLLRGVVFRMPCLWHHLPIRGTHRAKPRAG